jgi:hypothetical protein
VRACGECAREKWRRQLYEKLKAEIEKLKAEMIESPQTQPGVGVRSITPSFAAAEVTRLIILISNSKFRIPNLK